MAAYTSAIVLKNVLVDIEDVEYQNQVTKARLVPEVNMQTMRTLAPDGQIVDIDSPVWTLELEGVQDHEAGGVAAAIHAAAGTLITIKIAPDNTVGDVQWTVEAMAVPVELGGSQGGFATFAISMPVSGQPTEGTVSA